MLLYQLKLEIYLIALVSTKNKRKRMFNENIKILNIKNTKNIKTLILLMFINRMEFKSKLKNKFVKKLM